ncbi:LysR family transcriptional regulator [Thalassotalea fusca]
MKVNPLSSINPSVFPAFLAVAEHKSFTTAAEVLYKTQSGISRHVSELEKQLGVQLFIRTQKEVELTEIGHSFVDLIKQHLDSLDRLYDEAQNEREGYRGKVRYAMPPSCLLSPHFPIILDKRKDFPELEINVELMPNDDIFDLVLGSHADFGFVTERINNPALHYEPFCQEEYVLVGSPEYVSGLTSDNVTEQKYVSYPGMDVYFDFWINHFLPYEKFTKARSLYYAGAINVIEGAITMVKKGVGLSVFPRHCVSQYLDSGELEIFLPSETGPLTNWIYIVQPKSNATPRRVSMVIEWFLEMHRDD